MVSDRTVYGANDIPSGDQIRFGSKTSIPSGVLTTFLAVSPTNGGILQGFWFSVPNAAIDDFRVDEIRFTIDGASERTIGSGTFNWSIWEVSSDVGQYQSVYFPLWVAFQSSLTLKLLSNGAGSAVIDALAIYSENP